MQATLFDEAPAMPDAMRTHAAPARRDYRAKAEQAATHAERVAPGWRDLAELLFLDFALLKSEGKPFLAEVAVTYAHANRLPNPPDRRAWGSIVQGLARKGRIRPSGFALDSTGSPKTQWVLA